MTALRWDAISPSSRRDAKTRREEDGLHCDSYFTLRDSKWLLPKSIEVVVRFRVVHPRDRFGETISWFERKTT